MHRKRAAEAPTSAWLVHLVIAKRQEANNSLEQTLHLIIAKRPASMRIVALDHLDDLTVCQIFEFGKKIALELWRSREYHAKIRQVIAIHPDLKEKIIVMSF